MNDFMSIKRGTQFGGLTLVRGGATFDLSPAEIRQVIVATGKLLVLPAELDALLTLARESTAQGMRANMYGTQADTARAVKAEQEFATAMEAIYPEENE